jgi:hypothetical protein
MEEAAAKNKSIAKYHVNIVFKNSKWRRMYFSFDKYKYSIISNNHHSCQGLQLNRLLVLH